MVSLGQELEQCKIDLEETGLTYTDSTEVMASVVEFLILHDTKCEVAPSGNGSYAFMIKTFNQ